MFAVNAFLKGLISGYGSFIKLLFNYIHYSLIAPPIISYVKCLSHVYLLAGNLKVWVSNRLSKDHFRLLIELNLRLLFSTTTKVHRIICRGRTWRVLSLIIKVWAVLLIFNVAKLHINTLIQPVFLFIRHHYIDLRHLFLWNQGGLNWRYFFVILHHVPSSHIIWAYAREALPLISRISTHFIWLAWVNLIWHRLKVFIGLDRLRLRISDLDGLRVWCIRHPAIFIILNRYSVWRSIICPLRGKDCSGFHGW